MKTIIYVPVYIKSEKDLPKETGYYVVWLSNDMNRMSVKWFIGHSAKEWDDVVYWFKPVELPDEEEIKKHNPYPNPISDAQLWKGVGFIIGANWFKSQILK